MARPEYTGNLKSEVLIKIGKPFSFVVFTIIPATMSWGEGEPQLIEPSIYSLEVNGQGPYHFVSGIIKKYLPDI